MATIAFDCPYCGNHFQVSGQYAGRMGFCKACKGRIIVPGVPEQTYVDELEVLFAKLLKSRRAEERLQERVKELEERLEVEVAPEASPDESAEALREVAERLAEMQQTADASANRIALLEKDLERAHNELRHARGELEARGKERVAEAGELEAVRTETEGLRRRLEERESAFAQLQAAADEARQQAQDRWGEIEELRQQLVQADAHAGELKERCGTLEQELAAMRTDTVAEARAHDAAEDLARKLHEVEDELSRSRAQAASVPALEAKLAEEESLRGELDSLRHEKEQIERQLAEALDELEQTKRLVGRLTREIGERLQASFADAFNVTVDEPDAVVTPETARNGGADGGWDSVGADATDGIADMNTADRVPEVIDDEIEQEREEMVEALMRFLRSR